MAVNNFSLVFHIDIFILALVAAFTLSTLPRAIARFSTAAEWRRGHILRSTRLGPPRRRGPSSNGGVTNSNPALSDEKEAPPQVAGYASSSGHEHFGSGDGVMSEESHTYFSHTNLLPHPSTRISGSVSNLPPHFRSWSTVTPEIGAILRHRLSPGFSVGQAFVRVLYTTVLVYASFLKSNPFEDPLRVGFVAMSQIPIVIALGTKNNIIGMCVGMGYERLNYLHRFAGLMLVLLSNIHALGYIYTWTFQNQFKARMQVPATRMAFVSLIALDLLFFFSTSFWRRRAYNIFITTHIVGFAIFLPLLYPHAKGMLHYIIAAAAVYGLDRIMRLLKTRIFNARVRPIPDLSLTRIDIPALNAGWRPGQHVRIRVLSTAMGMLGWAEVHPFTIATVSKTSEGLVLMCKNVGGWTNRLYELAKVAGYGCEDASESRTVSIILEGPYGGPGHTVFASFSAAMFIVGGSGVTFALSAIQDLIQRDNDDSSRVKIIELIWSIQDPSALNPLVPLLSSFVQQSTRTPLRISVHYTRAADTAVHVPAKDGLPPGLTLTAGRPRIAKVLDAVIARTLSYGSGVKSHMDITGVVVGVCGPTAIGDEVAKAVSAVDPARRCTVGGIEIHEESFEW